MYFSGDVSNDAIASSVPWVAMGGNVITAAAAFQGNILQLIPNEQELYCVCAQEEREDPSAASRRPEGRAPGASGRTGKEGAFRTSGPEADPPLTGPAERPVHAFPLRPRSGSSQPFRRQPGSRRGGARGVAG